jgi:hypothetical protein
MTGMEWIAFGLGGAILTTLVVLAIGLTRH